MLHISNLSKIYPLPGRKTAEALRIANFNMGDREKVALVGPSGSGKSTLLHLIAGILRPTTGSIRLLDHQLETMGEAELDRFRASRIGYVFQSFNLIPGLSALENVTAAMSFGRVIPARERKARAATLLDQVGLSHRLQHKPAQLSSGEQQRVSIARALANRPALVLADEPTASLDYDNAQQVFILLTEACQLHGAGLLLCTHDLDIAGKLDRIVRIRDLRASGGESEAG
ncbi:ABC transporter ATP-binding protein [Gorillibacterium massiliense]|uniref:ABC transporter ATP-binding protein n=1 Tax=Gorillibacterium massiliense TaxID=1280390 RepID=UPI000593FC9B|nr:ABC transporter ATP-binding protein [Gorillibacterium massiliense]